MPTLDNKQALRNIAANVRHFRAHRSMAWLARAAGTYSINISRIEAAESMPGGGLLFRIAEALNVSTDQLLAAPPKNHASAP